jgi:hypothetical protein
MTLNIALTACAVVSGLVAAYCWSRSIAALMKQPELTTDAVNRWAASNAKFERGAALWTAFFVVLLVMSIIV